MKFEKLEARYVVPEMKNVFSLGDVDGLPRSIGPKRDMIVLSGYTTHGIEAWSAIDTTKFPIYGSESTVEAWALIQEVGETFLGKEFQTARDAVRSLGYLIDHPIFQAGFANLFMDAQAIEKGIPLYTLLGGKKDRIEVGVSISKSETPEQISEKITRDRFRRIKMKIGPDRADFNRVSEVKKLFPNVMLMVDANSSFDINIPQHVQLLKAYGELDLLMIEQPLAHNDITNHVQLQQLYNIEGIPGRICLDESIHSLDELHRAIKGGIPIINIKVTRVGGLDIAQTMIEECMRHNVDVWIGGMMELTSPGKAHSLAMATHPGVTLPSDISGTAAYFKPGEDPCVKPMEREGAFIAVTNTVGRGWEVDKEKMDGITKQKVVFTNR